MTQFTVHSTLDAIFDLTVGALMASGANRENAEAVAEVVWKAERDGCLSHGIFRVPGYCDALKANAVNGNAAPRVIDQAPGVVRVDAENGLAPLAMKVGRPALDRKGQVPGHRHAWHCELSTFRSALARCGAFSRRWPCRHEFRQQPSVRGTSGRQAGCVRHQPYGLCYPPPR